MINDLDEVQFAYLLAPTFQFVNSAGKPITGGWMEVYIHGTRTKYYCVSDWDGTLHPFKIPLDSLGSNIVLASPANAYDVYVYNRFGSLIMSRYNVIPSTGGASGVIPATIAIESDDDTVNVSVSGNTYNLSIGDTVDKLNTVSGDVEELKEAIASGFGQVQSNWNETDTTSPSYIQNKPDLSIYATVDSLETVSGDIVNLVNVGDTNLYNLVSSVSSTLETNIENASGNLVELISAVSSDIPTQMQSNWIEDDASSPSYIQNKPTEKQLVAGDNIGISVSGNDVIISASGTDLSDYATHTEVNNVSGGIINVVSSVSSTLQDEIDNIPEQVNSDWNAVSGKAEILNKPDLSVYATNSDLQIVSAAIPDVSNLATKTEVNSVSSILENEIQTISGAIPEPFEGYTSPSGTSYIDNVNYTIEQSNSAIGYITTYDWRARWQFPITTVPVSNTGFTPSTKEVKFVIPDTINGEIRLANNYEMTDYISGYFNDSSEVIFNIPQSWVGSTVYFYYNGDTSAYQISGYTKDGNPISTEAVRKLAWEDDLITVSASIPDVSDLVSEDELVSAINVITSTIPQAQVQSNWAETDSADPSYIQNKPDEINIVAGSGINIVASGTDLVISASATQQVPNVDIVSPSGSIIVGSSIDPITNTKTFSIDVATASGVEYGQFYATGVTGTANLARTKGNLSVNNGKIQLHKGQSYHVTIRGTYTQTTLANELSFFNFIEYISFRNIGVNVNKTISAGQYWEISYDVYNLSVDTDYIVAFTNISNAVLSDVFVEVHSLAGGNGTGGSASGVEYTAGYGIQILNDVISVSGINPQVNSDWNAVSGVSQILNKPTEVELVAGSGINITESNNQYIISSTVTGGGGSGVNYNAGDHIDISDNTISVTGITELVAGTNITITMNSDSAVISAAGGQQVQSNWDEYDSSSPAYIQNKPSIPQSPEQSDWNETDPYSLAYIKNKPNISEAYTGASGIAIDNSVISLDEPLGIVAGSGINIVIEGDSAIICVSGVSGGGGSVTGNYQEGYGIDITNDTISVDTTVIPTVSAVSAMIASASANDNLFIATWLTTTRQELLDAYSEGKYIVLLQSHNDSPHKQYSYTPLTYYRESNQGFYFITQYDNMINDTVYNYPLYYSYCISNTPNGAQHNKWDMSPLYLNSDWNETNTNSIKYIAHKPDLSVYTTSTQVSAIVEAATGSIPTPTQVNADWSATSGVAEILNKPVEANLLPGSGITISASGSDYVVNTTPIELVASLPANPVSGVLYLIPEA